MIDGRIEGSGLSVTFSELGLGIKRRDIPVLPETRDYSVAIAGVDGEVDFGSEYGPRIISHECVVMANDSTLDYHAKLARIAQVFNAKRGDLIVTYSDLPKRRYRMRYAGTMPIEKLIFDGNITIPMKMHDPFPESLQDTERREYDQGLEFGQGYEYNNSFFHITTSGQTIEIENQGSIDVRPLIRIIGSLQQLELSVDGQTFTFGGVMQATDTLLLNGDRYTVKLNDMNAYSQTNGVFLSLKPGVSTITCTASNPDFTIEFIFRHKYLY
ncbi:phage-related protein [Paenibacillus cellulosilyticus]|uniref:Phage-related protein n=1 Tax=Paenibacillus cellulosilyticus TaxID=375489 RepID=A0A2V2YWZ4_9BACL|nr:phage tail domain-containing protein [Paenibacillus cellulosilyticus]PWW06338.1 phage-related protein [Paenibacillus cellulosilyticus]QKS43446.1 phage tail family protein [Paenibacillus cellulosilyticus]QKS46310.1 phage tail family protein [Paenibacillus cellulosilyticus]